LSREVIVEKLKFFLANEFSGQGRKLNENTNLLGDWFLDSLGTLEVAMFLEEAFNLDVRREDINGDNFHSIATLTEFVLSRADD